jgi:hypothetical protein
MSWDLRELDQMIGTLRGLRKSMSNAGYEVFKKYGSTYEQIAKQASTQYLLGVPNKDVDPDVWADRVEDFVDLIFSRQGGNAFEIFYRGRMEGDQPSGARTDVTYADVLKWVQAGPEHGGKDKTILEQEKGHRDGRADEHIAYNVYEAIVQYRLGIPGGKDYGPITERLERWVKFGESGGYFMDLLPNLLGIWESVLEPIIRADLSAWMDAEIRRIR